MSTELLRKLRFTALIFSLRSSLHSHSSHSFGARAARIGGRFSRLHGSRIRYADESLDLAGSLASNNPNLSCGPQPTPQHIDAAAEGAVFGAGAMECCGSECGHEGSVFDDELCALNFVWAMLQRRRGRRAEGCSAVSNGVDDGSFFIVVRQGIRVVPEFPPARPPSPFCSAGQRCRFADFNRGFCCWR